MIDQKRISNAVKEILIALGEDPNRPGLIETPDRVARAYAEIFHGYEVREQDLWNYKMFKGEADGVVEIKDIPTYSCCEHHMLPMLGTTTVRYKTKNKNVIGLSKIPRLVKDVSQRLQLQERMTEEIASRLFQIMQPEWVEVEQNMRHMCVEMRGARSNSVTHSFCRKTASDEFKN